MGLLINIRNYLLAYSDSCGVVSNPDQKSWDWARQYLSIPAQNGTSDFSTVPAGGEITLFDGVSSLPSPMSLSTDLSLSLVSPQASIYRLKISNDGAFRDERDLDIDDTSQLGVSVNNNSIATFTLLSGSGDLSPASPGDVLRIKGFRTNETTDVVFAAANSGYWTVLSSDSTSLVAKRLPGKIFEGVNQTVTIGPTDTDNQFRVYSSQGIQEGDSFVLSGSLSPASFGDYDVLGVGPDFVDFVSAIPLPEQSGVQLSALSDLVFYSNAKKLVYIEADQNIAVRYNAQTGNDNVVTPVMVGNEKLPGFTSKFGHTYKCVVKNLSATDKLNIKWILSE